MVSFFNDENPLVPALQSFGTKGLFPDYDPRLAEPLKPATAKLWSDGLTQLHRKLDPSTLARIVAQAESRPEVPANDAPTRGTALQSAVGKVLSRLTTQPLRTVNLGVRASKVNIAPTLQDNAGLAAHVLFRPNFDRYTPGSM